jgi:hypothetical protein
MMARPVALRAAGAAGAGDRATGPGAGDRATGPGAADRATQSGSTAPSLTHTRKADKIMKSTSL